jgi:hypothetical protein
MIVVKTSEEKRLEELEKVNAVCPDNFCIDTYDLKFNLKRKIENVKWRLDRQSVESWCKKKEIELFYFDTFEEYIEWHELGLQTTVLKSNLVDLNQKQKETIERLKTAIQNKELKVREILKEITLLEIDAFHEVNTELLNDEQLLNDEK